MKKLIPVTVLHTMTRMMDNQAVNALRALDLMKNKAVLVIPASAMLVRMECGRILLSSRNCFLKLFEADFLELFRDADFYIRTQDFELDEVREQEYYAWRREKQ